VILKHIRIVVVTP